MKINMNVSIDITDEFVEDVIVTMFEGGSTYWIDHVECDIQNKPKGMPVSEWITKQLLADKEIKIIDNEFGDEVVLTIDKFIIGLGEWVKEYPERVSFESIFVNETHERLLMIDAGNIDANEADLILQFAVFNGVVFG